MFNAISYVTSGISLVAFLAAVAAFAYRRRLALDEREIQSAPKSERAKLILAKWGAITIVTDDLKKTDRYKLAQRQLLNRARQARAATILVGIIAILFALLAALSIVKANTSKERELKDRLKSQQALIEQLTTRTHDLDKDVDGYRALMKDLVAMAKVPGQAENITSALENARNSEKRIRELEEAVSAKLKGTGVF